MKSFQLLTSSSGGTSGIDTMKSPTNNYGKAKNGLEHFPVKNMSYNYNVR